MSSKTIIRLENLRKEFGDLVAVDDLNLEIGEGEFLCFLGPSGCGKTTTLRMIAGLENPTSGELYLREQRITQLPPQDRGVGFMFQNYALFWHMTVYDNLAFGLRVRGASREEMDQKVREVAAGLELSELLDVRASKLDLSAMQRVAMARVLVIEPEVLLLDEPLNNFRPGLRETMRGELKRSQRQLGRTMIYVTHDQEEAMTLGDRILVMDAGAKQQLDTPQAIYAEPANLFVASFIGRPPMNFLKVRYEVDGERAALGSNGFRVEATPITGVKLPKAELILGIRPHHIRLVNGSSTDSDSMVAKVDMVQHLARKKILDLSMGEVAMKMVVAGSQAVTRGDHLRIGFPPEHIHLFDPNSGNVMH